MKYLPFIALIFLAACTANTPTPNTTPGAPPADLSTYHRATFAGGCFWCEEAIFERITGVAEVISGYSGGSEPNPSYEQVGSGATGHAEAFEVYYDSSKIDYPSLLRVFLASIDPTQVNGQGPDRGMQYRSIVFYNNETERGIADQALSNLAQSGKYTRPIVVQLIPFQKFWPAEDYHQNYVQHHPENPYVQHESLPRMKRTLQQVPELVKGNQ
ncbi:MAG: peptide-methionine (S)-S-oxide reductase MsrA [Saprospiraceae bacterium]|nr:peptide-methionine (S)-S-oxide reductase MsrA [Saprospiraceae bacterium]